MPYPNSYLNRLQNVGFSGEIVNSGEMLYLPELFGFNPADTPVVELMLFCAEPSSQVSIAREGDVSRYYNLAEIMIGDDNGFIHYCEPMHSLAISLGCFLSSSDRGSLAYARARTPAVLSDKIIGDTPGNMNHLYLENRNTYGKLSTPFAASPGDFEVAFDSATSNYIQINGTVGGTGGVQALTAQGTFQNVTARASGARIDYQVVGAPSSTNVPKLELLNDLAAQSFRFLPIASELGIRAMRPGSTYWILFCRKWRFQDAYGV